MVCFRQLAEKGQATVQDGYNLNCWLPSSQSKLANYYATSWKVEFLVFSHKNLALIVSTSTPATTRNVQLFGMAQLDDAACFRRDFVKVKLCTARQSTDCLPNFCPTTLQPANWTLKIDVTLLHLDGTITNRKEIGLGRLLPSWFQDDIFTLQVQLNRCELWRSLTRAF